MDIFLKTVAPYPPGTEIVLSDGACGIVVSTPENRLDRPVVRVVGDDDEGDSPVEVALVDHPDIGIEDAPATEPVHAA